MRYQVILLIVGLLFSSVVLVSTTMVSPITETNALATTAKSLTQFQPSTKTIFDNSKAKQAEAARKIEDAGSLKEALEVLGIGWKFHVEKPLSQTLSTILLSPEFKAVSELAEKLYNDKPHDYLTQALREAYSPHFDLMIRHVVHTGSEDAKAALRKYSLIPN
ncbi:hypothetical protein Plhal304r1_c008g0031171 [Plasmopara halstedii]